VLQHQTHLTCCISPWLSVVASASTFGFSSGQSILASTFVLKLTSLISVCGGIFNPAVSLGMFLVGALPPVRAALLVIAQILGATAGYASFSFRCALILIYSKFCYHPSAHTWLVICTNYTWCRRFYHPWVVHRDVLDIYGKSFFNSPCSFCSSFCLSS
jgi:hypothetical protein